MLLVRDGAAQLRHRLVQGDFLARGEVHQGIVNVEEKIFVFPGGLVQGASCLFSCLIYALPYTIRARNSTKPVQSALHSIKKTENEEK
ncbi:hypothetical protein SDC9_120188 [bioreactor metagenome]|uniref:Uncharacterized protein n=1 Tax=bioreactor metagenome TaxID=1076179 RepID=A0A645C6B0_9ZZZZ